MKQVSFLLLILLSAILSQVQIEENNVPIAKDQSVVTNENTPVAVTLTDSDGDGDLLTYSVVVEPRKWYFICYSV